MSTLLSFERHENTPLREQLRKYLHTFRIEPQLSLSLVRYSREVLLDNGTQSNKQLELELEWNLPHFT